MLCSICNKNTAVIFINKQDETGKQELQGLCYECAKAKGINPIDSLMKQANLSENDLNDMTKQLETIVKDMANNIDLSSIDPSSFTSDDSTNFEDNPTPQFSAIPLGSIFSNMFGENAEGAQESSSDRKKVKVDKKVKDKKKKALDTFGTNLTQKAKNNQLDEQLIDESVKRVLAIKFKLGLFENPYIKENVINIEKVQEKRNLSEIIAEESIVLLENKDNILPLTKNRKIALIGPHADNKRYPIAGYTYPAYIEMLKSLKKNVKKDVSFNGIIDEEQKDEDTQSFNSIYSILNEDDWKKLDDEIHILDEIGAVSLKESLEKYYQIDYIKGCTLIGKDYDEIEESYNLAMKNDVIVVALGGNCGWVNVTSGEGKDRCKLNLPGIQEKLLEKLQMTNKPIVLVLYGGVYVIPSMKNIQAILYVGLPGPYSGNVISNIISGKVNPSGKLPISIPRSVGQIPIYYNHKVGSGYYSNGDEVMQTIFSGGYIDESYRPLYPFGFGLSYTKF